jgi:FixJ family two-component response regulator
MCALLKSIGYAASAYESAEDLLASAVLARTACIITDVRMPGMSGIELHARLKDGGWSMPVILISAFSQDGLETQALAAGVHAFLKKPCSQAALVENLRSALGAHPRLEFLRHHYPLG